LVRDGKSVSVKVEAEVTADKTGVSYTNIALNLQ
jgi:hypothetical protein